MLEINMLSPSYICSTSIKCCFWDDMAEKVSAALENENETPLIVIIASCKHNEYKGVKNLITI